MADCIVIQFCFIFNYWTPFRLFWKWTPSNYFERKFIIVIFLVSGQKWREFKIRARRNSWAVEHRNQFPVPPAESDEEDEDTSWVDYTTYDMGGLSPLNHSEIKCVGFVGCYLYYLIGTWRAIEIWAKRTTFVTLKYRIRSWFRARRRIHIMLLRGNGG